MARTAQATSTPLGTVAATPSASLPYSYSSGDLRCAVTEIRVLESIPGGVKAPEATKFAIVFETITNAGDVPHTIQEPGFDLRDDRGRAYSFDAPYPAQNDAERSFKREGAYESIVLGPGVAEDFIFVFVVSYDATGLVVER